MHKGTKENWSGPGKISHTIVTQVLGGLVLWLLGGCACVVLLCAPTRMISVPLLFLSKPRVRFSTPMMEDSDDSATYAVVGSLL